MSGVLFLNIINVVKCYFVSAVVSSSKSMTNLERSGSALTRLASVAPIQFGELPSEILTIILSKLNLEDIIQQELYRVCNLWKTTIPIAIPLTTVSFNVEYTHQEFMLKVLTDCKNAADRVCNIFYPKNTCNSRNNEKFHMLLNMYSKKIKHMIVELAGFPAPFLNADNDSTVCFEKYLMKCVVQAVSCHNTLHSLSLNPSKWNSTVQELEVSCNAFVAAMSTIPSVHTFSLSCSWYRVIQLHTLEMLSVTELRIHEDNLLWCTPTYSFTHYLPPLLEKLAIRSLNVLITNEGEIETLRITYPKMIVLEIRGTVCTNSGFLEAITGSFPNLKALSIERIDYQYSRRNETFSFMSLVKDCRSLTYLDVFDVHNGSILPRNLHPPSAVKNNISIQKVEWPNDGRKPLHITKGHDDITYDHPSNTITGNVHVLVEPVDIERERLKFHKLWAAHIDHT